MVTVDELSSSSSESAASAPLFAFILDTHTCVKKSSQRITNATSVPLFAFSFDMHAYAEQAAKEEEEEEEQNYLFTHVKETGAHQYCERVS